MVADEGAVVSVVDVVVVATALGDGEGLDGEADVGDGEGMGVLEGGGTGDVLTEGTGDEEVVGIVVLAVVVDDIAGTAGIVVVPVCPMGCAGIVPEGVGKDCICSWGVMPNLLSNPGGITPDFPAPRVINSLTFASVLGPTEPIASMPCFS